MRQEGHNFNMIRIVRFLTVLIILSSSVLAYAVGPATVYKVRVKKLELWNGSSWITAFEGTSSTMDIASVNSGQAAGQFLSGLTVPDGVYSQVRVTPHTSFNVQGNDGARYTLAANGNDGGCTYTTVAALAAECTITLPPPNEPAPTTQDFSATPITVKDGVCDRKIRVAFDVSTAISYNVPADEIFPAEPTVTMTAQ